MKISAGQKGIGVWILDSMYHKRPRSFTKDMKFMKGLLVIYKLT